MIALWAAVWAQASLTVNRTWDVLEPADERTMLYAAGEALALQEIELAGVVLDGPRLMAMALTSPEEPLLRVVREAVRRPVELPDLLYFLDDVLASSRPDERFFVGAGRARGAGLLVHPREVWRGESRLYPAADTLAVDQPPPQASHPPAADGDGPGPGWSTRYLNPSERPELMAALAAANPDFAERVEHLLGQLEGAGAEVWVTSTVRKPERGYLMWGAYELSRCDAPSCVEEVALELDDRNVVWDLAVPVTWRHADGWEATVEQARQMADAYDVVYATEKGARSSSHYGGSAVDLVVVGLPRSLTLVAPSGSARTFDLSAPEEPRDLSLTPEVVRWVETQYSFSKLETDYPHWSDARAR